MDITDANAGTLLPYIAAQLRDCSFFALDLEFTGIDRGRFDGSTDTPDAVIDSLMRNPAEGYTKKLETLKPYSIVQIGFSIFTRQPSVSCTDTPTSKSAIAPSVEDLARDVAEFVPDITAKDYCCAVLKSTVDNYKRGFHESNASAASAGWRAVANHLAKEISRVTAHMTAVEARSETMLSAPNGSHATPHTRHATGSMVELLRHYRFLDALSRAVARRSRESVQCHRATHPSANGRHDMDGSSGSGTPPAADSVVGYRVQTFTAYMFPAVVDEAQNVSLNIDTMEFLVKNNIDLMRWVKEGLRFKPFKHVTSALVEEAATRLRDMKQLFDPHYGLPHFTECFKTKLDDLLPFSLGELQMVKFVLDLFEAPPSPALGHVRPYYIGAVRPLIQFSRGDVGESALPESICLRDKIYRDEMAALSAIGITKANRKFARMPSTANGSGGGAAAGGSSAHGSAITLQGNGTALLETLLYATEVLRKPIIFYNGYTDLMFLLLSVYGPQGMPTTMDAFKAVVHQHFPVVYDTRVLACAGPLQELGNFTGKLSSAMEEMSKVRAIAPRVSFTFDGLVMGGLDPSMSSAAHNAGFDAMLTGKLFAYAIYGIEAAHGNYEQYLNFLATYSTLLSINLTEKEDGMLQEQPTPVYYLADSCGLRVDSIRGALAKGGLTAVVMFRGSGYTIQPVGKSCQVQDFARRAEAELTRQAHSTITLTHIDI